MSYVEHDVEWNEAQIERFWTSHYHHKSRRGLSFSRMVGDGIISLAQKNRAIGTCVLDYGCGDGDLIGHLLQSNTESVYGCDLNNSAVDYVNSEFSTHEHFKGGFLTTDLDSKLPENMFDTIFLIETIEHLSHDKFAWILQQIKRLLHPEGSLIVTVPNDENLDLHKMTCPDCGAMFHTMQHVNTFTETTLTVFMGKFDMETQFCRALDLSSYRPDFKAFLKRILDLLMRNKPPHLFWIGKRRTQPGIKQ